MVYLLIRLYSFGYFAGQEMHACGKRVSTLRLLTLIGWGGLGMLCLDLQAGQPIKFSAPKEDVDMPVRSDINVKLPSATVKWPSRESIEDAPLPPMVQPLDPRLERRLRELQQEKKDWLFHDPAMFKDRFQNPFEAPKDGMSNPMKALDATVDRILGKSGDSSDKLSDKKKGDDKSFQLESIYYTEEPLFDTKKRKPDHPTDNGFREKGEHDGHRSSAEGSMRALFDRENPPGHVPVQPGMSLYEMLGTASAKVQKREEETRHKEFSRLLGGGGMEPLPAPKPLDMSINMDDPSRGTLVQPVTPVSAIGLPIARAPNDPMFPMGFPERPSRSSILEDTSPRAPAAVQRPPDKARQLDSLNLLNRPTILEFPGRKY